MKHIALLSTAILFLFVFVAVNTASAQEKKESKDAKTEVSAKQTQDKGPRFVDEDGDGICDHQKDGSGKRQQHAGKGCNGSGKHDRARLRDGSCGDNPAAAPGTQRRGRQKNK